MGINNAIGSCQTDTFMISGATAGTGSPVICGNNDGHHMVLDSDGQSCHTINLMMGAGGANRAWNIDVVQYRCGNLDATPAGPPGCLQYHTLQTGRVSDYGYAALPATGAIAAQPFVATTTHLANQDYKICFRRVAAQCRICYTPVAAGIEGVGDQAGFGLSTQAAAGAAMSANEAACDNNDFISIPGAQTAADSLAGNLNLMVTRLCGRRFNNAVIASIATIQLCTRQTPFMIGVNFGAGEDVDGAAGTTANSENLTPPGGIIGFRLDYTQVCP